VCPEVLHAVEAFWDSCPDEEETVEESDTSEVTEQICLAISKAAVSGAPASRTVRLVGSIADIPVQFLVDLGSSSSFINSALVPRILAVSAVPLSASVQIAGGGVLQCTQLLRQVLWSVGDCTFKSDFKVLPLEVFDVVIGMDWLESFSPMQVHWLQKWLAIPYEGRIQILQGLTEDFPEQLLLHVDAVSSSDAVVPLPPEIQDLLHEFEGVFKPPTSLPPSRACNHEIPLILGAQPVFIRPYRYPLKLKDE
jgi:hypothetical protein